MDAWKLCKAKFFFNESSFRYLVVKTTAFLPRTILKLYEKFKTIRQPFCGLGGSCWRFNANILWECSWWQRREHHCTKLYIAWPFSLFFFSPLILSVCRIARQCYFSFFFFFPSLYFMLFFLFPSSNCASNRCVSFLHCLYNRFPVQYDSMCKARLFSGGIVLHCGNSRFHPRFASVCESNSRFPGTVLRVNCATFFLFF